MPQIAVAALAAQQKLVELLTAAAGEAWQDYDLVFPSPSGRPLSQSHVLERFHRVLKQAGLARRRMHDLRHTSATRRACSPWASTREQYRTCSATLDLRSR